VKTIEDEVLAPYYESSGMLDLVGRGSHIKGLLTTGLLVRIDGEVEGEVKGLDPYKATVIVGRTGVVNGNIVAAQIVVNGQVRGELHASQRIRVSPHGSVRGKLESPRVVVEKGAFIDGAFQMAIPSDNPLHDLK
jgi:cytoskeletal protein CcmA (bactofilin family)